MGAIEFVSIAPGVLGLLGAAAGYGSMRTKLKTLEAETRPLVRITQQIARIDERTKATSESVKAVKDQVDRIVERFLPHG